MNQRTHPNKSLQRIINLLILNASYIENIGFLNGKMGIATFFYHHSRLMGNKIFEDYAGELIDQVFKEIHVNSPVNFSSGLSGIGWGVKYLIRNGFIDSDDDNILEELNNAIFQFERKNTTLPRFYNDMYGFGLYYLCNSECEIWNEEALQLIWNDITSLLNESLSDEVKPCPEFIISLLYFLQEIQKRPYCPLGLNELITLLPSFVSKYLEGNFNDYQYQFVKILFQNLGIEFSHQYQPLTYQSINEENLELYGQTAIYKIVFPSIQSPIDPVSDYGLLTLLESEIAWESIFSKVNNEKSLSSLKLTGILLALLKTEWSISDVQKKIPNLKESIFIIDRKSRAEEYGIGTYIRVLTTCLKNKAWNVTVIHLEAVKTEFTIEDSEGIQNWYLPSRDYSYSNLSTSYNEYLRCITIILQLYINSSNKLIFQLNYMSDYQLVLCLRKVFECAILLVVHYLEWSNALRGDVNQMRTILSQPEVKIEDPKEKKALFFFKEDLKILNSVDQIVCLADFTYKMLCTDYGIEASKITVVNNGLFDLAPAKIIESRFGLMNKYRIESNEKIILYAGRLDEIKGVSYLIKAFKEVLDFEPNTKLWIIGDDAYNPLLKDAECIWNKLCFTGRISQVNLFELFSIADIGVIPSLFEPFGYVALEMMMHKLPIIATSTTGLDEIIEDGLSGLKVQVVVYNNKSEVDIGMLAKKIVFLLQNPEERERLGNNGRNRFLEMYTADVMCEKMLKCYQKLQQIKSNKMLQTEAF